MNHHRWHLVTQLILSTCARKHTTAWFKHEHTTTAYTFHELTFTHTHAHTYCKRAPHVSHYNAWLAAGLRAQLTYLHYIDCTDSDWCERHLQAPTRAPTPAPTRAPTPVSWTNFNKVLRWTSGGGFLNVEAHDALVSMYVIYAYVCISVSMLKWPKKWPCSFLSGESHTHTHTYLAQLAAGLGRLSNHLQRRSMYVNNQCCWHRLPLQCRCSAAGPCGSLNWKHVCRHVFGSSKYGYTHTRIYIYIYIYIYILQNPTPAPTRQPTPAPTPAPTAQPTPVSIAHFPTAAGLNHIALYVSTLHNCLARWQLRPSLSRAQFLWMTKVNDCPASNLSKFDYLGGMYLTNAIIEGHATAFNGF